MNAKVTYFPVGTADMSLVKLVDGFTILVDCYLQEEPTDNRHTVVDDLYDVLPEDDLGRPYVDAFMLTHPDEDHCKGAADFLHLTSPDLYDDDPGDDNRKKIFVRGMWSSPLVYRRRSSKHKLCDDAAAINTEAKRRVEVFRTCSADEAEAHGNRIVILGSDYKEEDDTDRLEGLGDIVVDVDETFEITDEGGRLLLEATVLGPLPPSEIDGDEDVLTKNNSSVILNMAVKAQAGGDSDNLLLFGGDAEVEIWRRLRDKHGNDLNPLVYDILLAPHHCSWGVLSDDAASDNSAKVDPKARDALAQGRDNCYIVTSCEPIKDNKGLPPMLRAKNEYIDILDDSTDHFFCTGEYPAENAPTPLTFDLMAYGPKAPSKKTVTTAKTAASTILSREPRGHG